MITKNSSGANLSADYDTAVVTSPRKWQVSLFLNGTLLNCAIAKLEIKKGSCGSGESFSLGNVFSSMMTADLLELTTDIKGEDLEVRIGLETAPSTWEWITAGWFTAIEVVKAELLTRVTAYGFSVSKTSGAFTIPATLSLSNIATAIYLATGLTVTFDSTINTAKVLDSTLESGISCYAGLQVLAHAVGGYAVDTYDGNFAIHQFSDTPTLAVDLDLMLTQPNIEEQAFDITGVQVNTDWYEYVLTSDVAIDPNKTYYTRSGSGTQQDPYVYTEVESPVVADIGTYYEEVEVVYTSGSPVVLYDTNANMSADVFNNVYANIVGYSYYTGSIDLSVGDPRIQGDDVVSITVGADTYIVPCHMVTHSYDGGISTSIEAVKATPDGDGLASNAPITQQIDQIGRATAVAKASAESAVKYAEQAQQSATTAYNLALQVEDLAQQASTDAQLASDSASSAVSSAGIALDHLSIVEDIVGVLELIAEHGDYQATENTEVVPDKWYFIRSGSGTQQDPYVYTVVADPSGDPNAQGWYELTGIDQAIQNYVSSQLAVDSAGLWLKRPEATGIQTKVLLSDTEGVVLYGTNGAVVGKYGATAQIGDTSGFHIEIDGTELGFYEGTNRVAYISNQQLYITQSVVLQQMDIGTPTQNNIGGQWSWKVHKNASGQNNLNLKWIG